MSGICNQECKKEELLGKVSEYALRLHLNTSLEYTVHVQSRSSERLGKN